MPPTELLSSQVPRIQSQKFFTFSFLVGNCETWVNVIAAGFGLEFNARIDLLRRSSSDFSESNTSCYRIYTHLGIRYPACSGREALQTLWRPRASIQSIRARADPSKSSSIFLARTHELLQYHFRTVALAFEYHKEVARELPSAFRFAHSRDGERSPNGRGVFRPKSRRLFGTTTTPNRGVNGPISGEDIQWLLLDRTRLAKQGKKV